MSQSLGVENVTVWPKLSGSQKAAGNTPGHQEVKRSVKKIRSVKALG